MYKKFAFAIFVMSAYLVICASDIEKNIAKHTCCSSNTCPENKNNQTEKTKLKDVQNNSAVLLSPHFASRSSLENMYFKKRAKL